MVPAIPYWGFNPRYENDDRQITLTFVLLGIASIVSIGLLMLAVLSA